jgi:hypothetical protein
MGKTPPRPELVAMGRVGRLTRSVKAVEARQQELRERRVELLDQLAEARRQYDALRATATP